MLFAVLILGGCGVASTVTPQGAGWGLLGVGGGPAVSSSRSRAHIEVHAGGQETQIMALVNAIKQGGLQTFQNIFTDGI